MRVLLLLFTFHFSLFAFSSDYPIEGVTFDCVTLNDAFWAPRLRQHQQTTLPIALEQCYSTGRVLNFQKAAAILQGNNIGYFATDYTFDDTDIYKLLEGMSYAYRQSPTQELLDSINSLVAIVAAAQEEDGYLVTARTAGDPSNLHSWLGAARWEYDPNLSHELYNSGHLIEAAVAHFQATGDSTLLQVATRNADLLVEQFLNGGLAYEPGHQIVEMALVRLYRLTGQDDYLRLAKYFLDIRGIGGPNSLAYAYNQSHAAPTAQTEAVGHAVRAAYMYSGMADIAAIMADESYLSAINALWQNVSERKLYLTGGIGALHNGEAFGSDYELPNATAYNETCAAIALVYWAQRMFQLTGQGQYIDYLERTLYNGLISGIGLSGDRFFYPNPLASEGGYGRSEWFGCACCPSNLCRFIPSLPGYVYARRADSIYVNLYIASRAEIATDGGTLVLCQQTDYPWDGSIQLSIEAAPTDEQTLLLRLPTWAQGKPVASDLYSYLDSTPADVQLLLNGDTLAVQATDGYLAITRQWEAGDVVSLCLPMDIRRVTAADDVTADAGLVAIERGPIVYCLEWADNDGYVFSAVIPDTATITAHTDSLAFADFAHTPVTLSIDALNVVYDANAQLSLQPYTFTAIPYYAWANRGDGAMSVWMARSSSMATASLQEVASTDTLTIELGQLAATTADEYPYHPITIDRAAVAEAFGVSFPNTAALFGTDISYAALTPAGSLHTVSTANDPGHWFGSEGNIVSWVENVSATTNTADIPRLYSEFTPATYTFNVGQYPQVNTTGDTIAFAQALTYVPANGGSTARVVVQFIIHITTAKQMHSLAKAYAKTFANSPLYEGVTGSERTTLDKAIARTPSASTAYKAATDSLYAAITAFVNANTDYVLAIADVAASQPDTPATIYTLTGTRLSLPAEALPPGIYIINGRKRLIR